MRASRGQARRAAAALIGAALAATGCSAAATVLPVGQGSCTLALNLREPGGGVVPLRPPYVVGMNRETPSGVRTAHVEYVASGWQDARVTVETPGGERFPAAIRWFDRSSFGQGFDEPGIWTVHWEDATTGCVRELSVLVLA